MKFFFGCTFMNKKELYTEQQMVNCLKKYDNILIYGAGVVANEVTLRLQRYGIDYSAVITSGGGGYLHNRRIYKFGECLEKAKISSTVVLIATREEFHEEIIKKLNDEGIIEYYVVSNRLLQSIQRINGRRFKFQTHIVEHCNLKCKGCYHFSPLAEEKYLDEKVYERDIKKLGELFWGDIDEVLLLGGEPLLHPNVEDFFEITRKYVNNECQVKVLTNGLLLLQKGERFYKSLKKNNVQLWVTKYPVSFDYSEAEKFAASYEVELKYFQQEPVRTLGHQPLDITGSQNYETNYFGCYRANECIDLKHGKLYTCIIPAEIEAFNKFFNTNLEVCENDYIDIYQVKNKEEILEKLERPIPFCRYCNRNKAQCFGAFPWEKTHFSIKEWTV